MSLLNRIVMWQGTDVDTEFQLISEIHGAYLISRPPSDDERGWFRDALRLGDLPDSVAPLISPRQVSVSFSNKDVVRGLHYSVVDSAGGFYQSVTCVAGKVSDVLFDLRVGSPTYGSVHRTNLSPSAGVTVVVPPGVGHGFKSLAEGSILVYAMSLDFPRAKTQGIRPDLPELRLWDPGETNVTVSAKDRSSPTLDDAKRRGLLPRWQPTGVAP